MQMTEDGSVLMTKLQFEQHCNILAILCPFSSTGLLLLTGLADEALASGGQGGPIRGHQWSP